MVWPISASNRLQGQAGAKPTSRVRTSSAALPEDHRGIQAAGHEAPGAPLGCVAPAWTMEKIWENDGFIIFYNGNNIES
jgi:hypothetical protein